MGRAAQVVGAAEIPLLACPPASSHANGYIYTGGVSSAPRFRDGLVGVNSGQMLRM